MALAVRPEAQAASSHIGRIADFGHGLENLSTVFLRTASELLTTRETVCWDTR